MTSKSTQEEWVPYSVPLETAQKWISNWINGDPGGKPLVPTDMRAFVVHREDFIELLAQHDTEFIRMYVGRRDDSDTGQYQPCLMLVSACRQKDIDPKAPNPIRLSIWLAICPSAVQVRMRRAKRVWRSSTMYSISAVPARPFATTQVRYSYKKSRPLRSYSTCLAMTCKKTCFDLLI